MECPQRLKIVWSSGAKAQKNAFSSREVRCLELFTDPDKKQIFQ
jgi:hypothetical protein